MEKKLVAIGVNRKTQKCTCIYCCATFEQLKENYALYDKEYHSTNWAGCDDIERTLEINNIKLTGNEFAQYEEIKGVDHDWGHIYDWCFTFDTVREVVLLPQPDAPPKSTVTEWESRKKAETLLDTLCDKLENKGYKCKYDKEVGGLILTRTITANKSNLNKLIKWSSSCFNEYKKSEVINIILHAISKGEDVERHFGTGSFTERNSYGWGYDFVIKDGKATLTHTVTKEQYIFI